MTLADGVYCMLLRDIIIKSSYESGVDDLVGTFYIPALECAITYDRIAGFFSSSSLSIAAQGVAALIVNGGKMRLLASPRLSKEDVEIINKATATSEEFFKNKLLNNVEVIGNEFEKDHLQALGWMVANKYLEIKLVLPIDEDGKIAEGNELFHQKIGVISDENGDYISFSGSLNESASGWIKNIEEFKVFKEWISGQKDFFESDKRKFDQFWYGKRDYVKVIDLPTAVEDKLITYSDDFSKETFIAKYYTKITPKRKKSIDDNLSLFQYQKKAVDMWIDNGCSMLFEMATGTGKTRTALACVNYLMKRENKLMVVISCPEGTLARQWENNEVKPAGFEFGQSIIVDGTNRKWRNELPTAINKISIGFINSLVIYTTHASSASSDFTMMIKKCPKSVSICFVGDEAHGLGALKNKQALLDRYNYRVGLSATPERWFDDTGTMVLRKFFGDKSFEFSIKDALTTINPITKKTFLVNYHYHPIFVQLSDEELKEYIRLSDRIRKMTKLSKEDEEYQKRMEKLLFERANIQKHAENKLPKLRELLDGLADNAERLLVFVSSEQLLDVMQILKEMHIPAHRFTQAEGTKKCAKYEGLSEREYLVKHFKKGTYKALVAISCLDEGIDIPNADKAILLANSTNPREYIQRIGRVIRQAEGKRNAHIYDFIISPRSAEFIPEELKEFEKNIFEKELLRVSEMAGNAINNAEVQQIIDLMR